MAYVLYTEKMLNRIAHLYMDGKTIAQIRGVMTLKYGKKRRVFKDFDIQNQLDDMGFSEEDVIN